MPVFAIPHVAMPAARASAFTRSSPLEARHERQADAAQHQIGNDFETCDEALLTIVSDTVVSDHHIESAIGRLAGDQRRAGPVIIAAKDFPASFRHLSLSPATTCPYCSPFPRFLLYLYQRICTRESVINNSKHDAAVAPRPTSTWSSLFC
jgi:hypothetical protein